MKLLLDTHAWVWAAAEPARLTDLGRALLLDPAVERLVSAVSFWEVAVLVRKGRVVLGDDPATWCRRACADLRATPLPLDAETALAAEALVGFERPDPADRFLVAAARLQGATLLTANRWIRSYPGVASAW